MTHILPSRRWPVTPVVLVALLAAVVHLFPLWRAWRNTPPEFRFTGILVPNPDMMQYQVWMREAARAGPIIRNSLTTEPHRPFLPVPFYWAIGTTARLTGLPPDPLYRLYGGLFAALFAAVTYLAVWWFFPDPHQRRWTYACFLIGGSLTALLRFVIDHSPLGGVGMVRYILFAGQGSLPGLERNRSEFAANLIFDPHYLLLWLLVIASVTLCYRLGERWTLGRLLAALVVLPLTVFVNVHLVVLLSAIFGSSAALLYARGLLERRRLFALLSCWLAGVAVAALIARIEHHSGHPFPTWRTGPTPIALVLMAYPLAFLALGWGMREYWARAGSRECVLLGWILGCLLITSSGPFYPFPNRGLLTLQLPLTLVAATIYFTARPRLQPALMAVIVVLMIPMIAPVIPRRLRDTRFDQERSVAWLSPAHQQVIQRVKTSAGPEDVLLAPKSVRLWLAPDFPGKLYVAHGFLTVGYQTKEYQLGRFLEDGDSARQADFLQAAGIRFVFVPPDDHPDRFRDVPGLLPIEVTRVGTLFEFVPAPLPRADRIPYEPDHLAAPASAEAQQ